jgi:hypothetical protein
MRTKLLSLGSFFLLVLLICVIYLVHETMPPVHTPPNGEMPMFWYRDVSNGPSSWPVDASGNIVAVEEFRSF